MRFLRQTGDIAGETADVIFASSSRVWQPTSAAVQAASIPAVPAPMTTTFVSRLTRRVL